MHLTEVINARQQAFAPIPGIGTRILNVLMASDASPQRIEDVKAYRDKLRSKRPGKTAKPEDSTNSVKSAGRKDSLGDAPRKTVSYLDYESRVRNFRSIIDLAAMETRYKANEPEFSITSLNALVASLGAVNEAVNHARTAYGNARAARKAALYSDAGLAGASKRVKKYILFACGAKSEQYRRVSGVTVKSR
jgi:hypothetical protein